MKKKIRIKARWTNYGPKFYVAGRRIDCVRETEFWSVAVSDLDRWLWQNMPGVWPEFYGDSAEIATKEWDRMIASYNALTELHSEQRQRAIGDELSIQKR